MNAVLGLPRVKELNALTDEITPHGLKIAALFHQFSCVGSSTRRSWTGFLPVCIEKTTNFRSMLALSSSFRIFFIVIMPYSQERKNPTQNEPMACACAHKSKCYKSISKMLTAAESDGNQSSQAKQGWCYQFHNMPRVQE